MLSPLVTVRLSATDNAYFYTTWMVGGIFLIVSPAVASSLFAEGSNSTHQLRERTRSCARIITVLLLPLMLVFLVGGRFILGLFGTSYAQHGQWLLVFMTVTAIPDAITNIYVSVLRVRGRLHEAALVNLGLAVLALVLTWLLLPPMGIMGVGVAWLIGQSAGSLYVWSRVVPAAQEEEVGR
jgi:O-antigen/teichoic acid export membrane protein